MPITRREAIHRQAAAGLGLMGWAQAEAAAPQDPRAPRPYRVAPRHAPAAELLAPSALHLGGWLGGRVALNAQRRLRHVDLQPLLAGFQHKPGSHAWIGEHIGKWLHAATLAWSNTGDPALRTKLDNAAKALIAAQESDGYLGTYRPEQRLGLFPDADWDVWSHKYAILGLLTYHRYTGHAGALQACRKAADLLIATFPSRRSILAAGTHEGMAATSVLEPMVQLYRVTAAPRYLRFARYLVASWDEPGGPALVRSLSAGQPVNRVSNGKAYEMLSNLVGLCELASVTGDEQALTAVLNAWQDVVDKRLFLTGSTSQFEHFQTDHDLRDSATMNIAETCVTTTWIQLNLALLQLTGEARFGHELERSFYNHLSAAQHPDGEDWCYYTAMQGRKAYDKGITCCHSSGPRGLALAPQASYLRAHGDGVDTLLVNTLEPSSVSVQLGGQRVRVELLSGFPYRSESRLRLHLARPARFALKLRAPPWAGPVNMAGATLRQGWMDVPAREWKDGDELPFSYTLGARTVHGEHALLGHTALAWGPFVLALEQSPSLAASRSLGVRQDRPVRQMAAPGQPLRFQTLLERPVQGPGEGPAGGDEGAPRSGRTEERSATLLTFADAGTQQARYRVWLRSAEAPWPAARAGTSLLEDGEEGRSRTGNASGSINDGLLRHLVNTYNGQTAAEDWFAVTLDTPAAAARFVFTHGRSDHDGGWFDTQKGRPLVQIQREADGPWQTLGALADYPATTARDPGPLATGGSFTLRLDSPVRFMAVRVLGQAASGDRPEQSFVSCAQLQAFAE